MTERFVTDICLYRFECKNRCEIWKYLYPFSSSDLEWTNNDIFVVSWFNGEGKQIVVLVLYDQRIDQNREMHLLNNTHSVVDLEKWLKYVDMYLYHVYILWNTLSSIKAQLRFLKSKKFLHGFSHISNNKTNVEKYYNIVLRCTYWLMHFIIRNLPLDEDRDGTERIHCCSRRMSIHWLRAEENVLIS